MNIFRHDFNNNLIDDINIVADASGILDVSEFKIFQMAFYAWFGENGNSKFIETCFSNYLINNKLPIWVRNYARRIVNDYNRNIFKAEQNKKIIKKSYSLPVSDDVSIFNLIFVIAFLGLIFGLSIYLGYSFIGISGEL